MNLAEAILYIEKHVDKKIAKGYGYFKTAAKTKEKEALDPFEDIFEEDTATGSRSRSRGRSSPIRRDESNIDIEDEIGRGYEDGYKKRKPNEEVFDQKKWIAAEEIKLDEEKVTKSKEQVFKLENKNNKKDPVPLVRVIKPKEEEEFDWKKWMNEEEIDAAKKGSPSVTLTRPKEEEFDWKKWLTEEEIEETKKVLAKKGEKPIASPRRDKRDDDDDFPWEKWMAEEETALKNKKITIETVSVIDKSGNFHTIEAWEKATKNIRGLIVGAKEAPDKHVFSKEINAVLPGIGGSRTAGGPKETFDAFIRYYQGSPAINRYIADNNSDKITNFLAMCYIQLRKEIAQNSKLQMKIAPLYRGIHLAKETVFELYSPGTQGFWRAFTSTSTDQNISKGFGGLAVMFEIHLDWSNPHPHLMLGIFTKNDYQKEVLLFPYFAFRVRSVKFEKNAFYIILDQEESVTMNF